MGHDWGQENKAYTTNWHRDNCEKEGKEVGVGGYKSQNKTIF